MATKIGVADKVIFLRMFALALLQSPDRVVLHDFTSDDQICVSRHGKPRVVLHYSGLALRIRALVARDRHHTTKLRAVDIDRIWDNYIKLILTDHEQFEKDFKNIFSPMLIEVCKEAERTQYGEPTARIDSPLRSNE